MLELLQMLVPSVVERCRETSALGSMARAQDELWKLKHLPKTVETTDHLMVKYLRVFIAFLYQSLRSASGRASPLGNHILLYIRTYAHIYFRGAPIMLWPIIGRPIIGAK